MHANVIMAGQLDEHLLFWQPAIYMLHCTYCLLVQMEIKYDDDDDEQRSSIR